MQQTEELKQVLLQFEQELLEREQEIVRKGAQFDWRILANGGVFKSNCKGRQKNQNGAIVTASLYNGEKHKLIIKN